MVAKALPWVATILFNIVGPIVVYDVAVGAGIGEVPALLLSGVPPLVELVGTLLVRRHADEFSWFVLILIALSVVVAVLGGGPQALLLRESAITGLFGLVLLGSLLLAPRPLMFYFGRRFATDGTPGGLAWWNGLWQYPQFRSMQRRLTLMWGGVLLVEAVVRAALTLGLSTGTMVVVNNVVPPVVIAVLVTITVTWGRRAGRQAAARRALDEPGSPAPAAGPNGQPA